jgi:hypothetical protein
MLLAQFGAKNFGASAKDVVCPAVFLSDGIEPNQGQHFSSVRRKEEDHGGESKETDW